MRNPFSCGADLDHLLSSRFACFCKCESQIWRHIVMSCPFPFYGCNIAVMPWWIFLKFRINIYKDLRMNQLDCVGGSSRVWWLNKVQFEHNICKTTSNYHSQNEVIQLSGVEHQLLIHHHGQYNSKSQRSRLAWPLSAWFWLCVFYFISPEDHEGIPLDFAYKLTWKKREKATNL